MSYPNTAPLSVRQAHSRVTLHRLFAVALVAIASIALIPAVASARGRGCSGSHTPIGRTSRAALQRSVVCLINRQRRAHGLPGLRENGKLNRSAQGWTNTMVAHRYFSHGADFASRISRVGFRWSTAGENIATGYRTPAAVVRAWMGSAGHCRNILSPTFRFVGTGASNRSVLGHAGGTWTQDFALLMGQRAPSGNFGPAAGCPYR